MLWCSLAGCLPGCPRCIGFPSMDSSFWLVKRYSEELMTVCFLSRRGKSSRSYRIPAHLEWFLYHEKCWESGKQHLWKTEAKQGMDVISLCHARGKGSQGILEFIQVDLWIMPSCNLQSWWHVSSWSLGWDAGTRNITASTLVLFYSQQKRWFGI